MSSTATQTTTAPAAQTLQAASLHEMFPDIDSSADPLSGHDEEQIRLMDEMCIVLDANDKPIGKASKKICHLMTNIDKGLLHRAFSVFLFNSNNELLLQQRASSKITFPDAWTNSCCSHPLSVSDETGSNLTAAIEGVKRAAQRKLNHELGIKKEQMPLDKFRFLTRIHYKSASDEKWGEHEIDYVLFIKADVDLVVNENEVQATQYVNQDKVHHMLEDRNVILTPWFKLLADSFLFKWWNKLDSDLEGFTGETEIRRM